MHPELYGAGVQSGWRDLGRVRERSRKKLCVRVSQPPLSVTFGGRANDAATTG